MSWAALTNVRWSEKTGQEFLWCKLACVCAQKNLSKTLLIGWLMTRCVHPPSPFPFPPIIHPHPPPPSPLSFFPSSVNSKYLSGSLPGIYAVLDVSNPRVFLQRVNSFQDKFSPIFHLWKQPNTAIHTRSSVQCNTPLVKINTVLTLRTKVLSLSGISSGMVVRTSTMADRGMLTLGFED